jgi:DNA-binding MarR family transcriptional regulator
MLSADERTAWGGLRYVHATLVRQLDAELQSEHGVSLLAYEVLLLLWRAADHRLPLADLAALAGLSLSGISHLADRLERDRLVMRQRSATDRRQTYAVLTAAGLALVRAAHRTHREGVRRAFLDRLSPAQITALGRCWEQIIPGAQFAMRRKA